MKTILKVAHHLLMAAVLVSLGACAGTSHRERNIVVGAGVGAVAGSVLTGGSPVGTVGGAAVGGLVGNEISRKR
ncbi:MAG: hypothetical protein RLZ81_1687 [Pseudomonadota bacterium]|jgi:osmotically inducible lipoprotein OsmB